MEKSTASNLPPRKVISVGEQLRDFGLFRTASTLTGYLSLVLASLSLAMGFGQAIILYADGSYRQSATYFGWLQVATWDWWLWGVILLAVSFILRLPLWLYARKNLRIREQEVFEWQLQRESERAKKKEAKLREKMTPAQWKLHLASQRKSEQRSEKNPRFLVKSRYRPSRQQATAGYQYSAIPVFGEEASDSEI